MRVRLPEDGHRSKVLFVVAFYRYRGNVHQPPRAVESSVPYPAVRGPMLHPGNPEWEIRTLDRATGLVGDLEDRGQLLQWHLACFVEGTAQQRLSRLIVVGELPVCTDHKDRHGQVTGPLSDED